MWACGPGAGLYVKPGPSACSMPLTLCYIGYKTNGHMTEPCQSEAWQSSLVLGRNCILLWRGPLGRHGCRPRATAFFRVVCRRGIRVTTELYAGRTRLPLDENTEHLHPAVGETGSAPWAFLLHEPVKPLLLPELRFRQCDQKSLDCYRSYQEALGKDYL